jgi:hypothetical protein
MKKVLNIGKNVGLVLGGFILGGMFMADGDTEETKITNEAPTEEVAKVEAEVKKEEPTKEEPKKEEPKKEEPKPVVKEPIQIYTDDKVTISFKEVSAEGVKFLVENKTNATITIQADSVAVNGFSSNNIMMSDDISPMSKGYAIAQTNELSEAGEPTNISGGLTIIDFDGSFDSYAVNFTNVSVQ